MSGISKLIQRVVLASLVGAVIVSAKTSPAPTPGGKPATDPAGVVELQAGASRLYGLLFTPDAQTMISADANRTVYLWNVDDWKLRTQFSPDEKSDSGIALAISRDGNLLAVAGESYIDVWDLHTGKRIALLRAENLQSVLFSDDAKTLYGQNFKGLYAFEVASGKLLQTYDIHANGAPALSADGKTLVSSVHPTRTGITYLDPATAALHTEPAQFQANGYSLLVTPGGKIAVSFDAEHEHVVWWEQATAKRLGALAITDAARIALSPSGKTVAAAFDRGRVLLIDLAAAKANLAIEPANVTGRGLAFTPDGKNLIMLAEKTVKIYPLATSTTQATSDSGKPVQSNKPAAAARPAAANNPPPQQPQQSPRRGLPPAQGVDLGGVGF